MFNQNGKDLATEINTFWTSLSCHKLGFETDNWDLLLVFISTQIVCIECILAKGLHGMNCRLWFLFCLLFYSSTTLVVGKFLFSAIFIFHVGVKRADFFHFIRKCRNCCSVYQISYVFKDDQGTIFRFASVYHIQGDGGLLDFSSHWAKAG